MLRHLLKLTWKRKSRNLMLSLEILLAFAIVFGVAAFALRYLQLYRMPLGFDSTNVWSVTIQAAFASFEPYAMSTYSGHKRRDGQAPQVRIEMIEADDALAGVLGLDLVDGRWFSERDNGSAARPAVINRRMADAMFPGERAVGQQFIDGGGTKTPATYRVVGVLDEFRAKGELATPVNFAFLRFEAGKTEEDVRTIVLKVKPGTQRDFETRLNRRLKLIRNDWTYRITPLSTLRKTMLHTGAMPLVVVSVIAAFMLVMVAFGLFGALWQNRTARIPEIGQIYRQIVLEQFMLSSIAIALGLALLVQLPLTGVLGESLNWTVFALAAGLSMLIIYLLSLLCALYPGWRASRLSPTEALHYE